MPCLERGDHRLAHRRRGWQVQVAKMERENTVAGGRVRTRFD
jgi:hypothetical protein